MDWKEYQEKTADFFRSLGLHAETDVTIKGARTTHDIDVLVKSKHAGFEITWIVECKLWQTKVTKLHVLSLREIVNETGADRGILLAENGFQSGAIEAAALTNVHLTSLKDVMGTASHDILSLRLREIYDRAVACKEIYWNIPKSTRMDYGLRPEVGDIGYSGEHVIKILEDLTSKGFRGIYPVSPDIHHVEISKFIAGESLPSEIASLEELVKISERMTKNLEDKLNYCIEQTKK